ncbi:MAG TPA: DUF1572 family protein [Pyrinomonadaceae bacterium]|nr:DUF1572 family protein [Pyrinomonadaceae bacterium]
MNTESSVAALFIKQASEFLVSEYLPKIERCLVQLDDDQIWWRANPQSNSIGNLVLHLCGNARQWIICGLGGETDQRHRDAEFAQRDVIERDKLVELLRSTVAGVAETLSRLDERTLLQTRVIQGNDVDVLYAIFHVTEHFSMHTGQIIMLTKMLVSRDMGFYGFDDGVPIHRW